MANLNNDTFDELEINVEELNETKNLAKKNVLHNKIKESIKIIEKEIEEYINIIDEIDINLTNKIMEDNKSDDIDINDDTKLNYLTWLTLHELTHVLVFNEHPYGHDGETPSHTSCTCLQFCDQG